MNTLPVIKKWKEVSTDGKWNIPSDIIWYIFDMYSILFVRMWELKAPNFRLVFSVAVEVDVIYDPNQYNLTRQLRCIYVVGTYVYMEQADKVTIG